MNIAVFCGSSPHCADKYGQAAAALGQAMAQRGIGLVYGGGNEGLMGAVARGALSAGGHVTAVHTRRFADYADALAVTEAIMTDTMAQRKAEMAARSDAFIALPGSMGTLDEISEVFVLTQLGIHHKPVGILNVDGFYDGLLMQLRRAVQDGFMKEAHLALLHVAPEPEALLDSLFS